MPTSEPAIATCQAQQVMAPHQSVGIENNKQYSVEITEKEPRTSHQLWQYKRQCHTAAREHFSNQQQGINPYQLIPPIRTMSNKQGAPQHQDDNIQNENSLGFPNEKGAPNLMTQLLVNVLTPPTLNYKSKPVNINNKKGKTVKETQKCYTKNRKFQPNFESNREAHLSDYLEKSSYWDVLDHNKILFLRYPLVPNSDATHFYDKTFSIARKSNTLIEWRGLHESFYAHFPSMPKQV